MKKNNYGFDTLMVHAGVEPDTSTGSVSSPIYMTTAYKFKDSDHAKRLFSLEENGNIYSRIMNPTSSMLDAKIAALEGGVGALSLASGHAAILTSILNIAQAGDEIVSTCYLYGGTYNLFKKTLKSLGITVRLVDGDNPEEFVKATNDKTKAYFVETIGNPNANVADIETIAKLAHENGVPLIVDSTFTTPYLMKPIEWGADIVIHSATKFLNGHGNSMCGIIVDGGKFNWDNGKFPMLVEPDESYHGIRYYRDCGAAAFITKAQTHLLRDLGACVSPMNSFLTMVGMETLSLRMKKHSENALAVAKYLESNENVSFVNYSGLESNRYHELAKKYLPKGQGSVFTFGLKGGREAGKKFIDSLELIMNVANVGDTRSLVIHPASTTHSQLSDDELKASGISAETIRLSIGIEDVDDIIADIDMAIEKSRK